MLKDGVRFCNDLMCDWNSLNPTYQQRLDKVLSKFDKKYDGFIAFELGIDIQIEYNLKTKEFWFNNGEFEISLKTVESILEDLEGDE